MNEMKYSKMEAKLFLKKPICPFCETDGIEYINTSSTKISGFELFGTDKYEYRYHYKCKNCENKFSTDRQLTIEPIMVVDGKEVNLRMHTEFRVCI